MEVELLHADVRSNPQVIKSIEKIVDQERQLRIIRKEILAKQASIQALQEQSADKQAEQQKMLMSTAVLVSRLSQHGQDQMDALEEIFIEGDERHQVQRHTLNEVIRFLKVIYCIGPVDGQIPDDVMGLIMQRTPEVQHH